MPFKLGSLLGAARKETWPQEKETRLAGTLVPFANNKIEFGFVGSQIRRKEHRKKTSLPSIQSDKYQVLG